MAIGTQPKAAVTLDKVKVEKLWLPLSKIKVDKRLQIRLQGIEGTAAVDQERVQAYAEALNLGATWDCITVAYWLGEYWVVNGFHSLEAHKVAKRQEIECEVYRVSQWDQMRILAATGNLKQDRVKPLTNDEKKRILRAMRQEGMPWYSLSQNQIARLHLNVSPDTVSRWLRELESSGDVPVVSVSTGADGVKRDIGQIGQGGKKKWENTRSTLQAAQGEAVEDLAEKRRILEAAEAADKQAREAREKLIKAKLEYERAEARAESLDQTEINARVMLAQMGEGIEAHPQMQNNPTPNPSPASGEGNEKVNYPMSDSGELMYQGKYVMYLRVDSFGVELTAGAQTIQLERKPMTAELARMLGEWLDSLEVKPSKVEPKRVIPKVDYDALGGGESNEGDMVGGYGYEADQDESEEVG